MRLTDALRLGPGRTVAFTGAGGKSSALEVLAREHRGGLPLVLTTTTRLGLGQKSLGDFHLIARSPQDLDALRLDPRAPVLVTGAEDLPQDKLLGLDTPTIDALAEICRSGGALLVIEADGARGRLLKAPAAHEPVVPSWVDVAVPVAGLAALGKPLDGATVHRPNRAAQVLGVREGAPLTPRLLTALLTSEQSALKGLPATAEVRLLLTGVEGRASQARQIAGEALLHPRVRSVLTAELAETDPVVEARGRTAAVVLAAGEGTRLGRIKPLVEWKGRALASHVLAAARLAGLSPIVIVTGYRADQVEQALASPDVIVVNNPAWADGQSTSVRRGVEAIEAVAEAAVFLLADMPRVSPETVRKMVDKHAGGLPQIVAPVAGSRRGNPVLFDRSVFAALKSLSGDQGGRALLDQMAWERVEADPQEFFQVERPQDLQTLKDLE